MLSTLDTQIKSLEKELKKNQDGIGKLAERNDSLISKLQKIKTSKNEVEQGTKAYDQFQSELKKSMSENKEYIERKSKMIDSVVNKKMKNTVEDKIKRIESKISDLKNEVKNQETDCKKKNENYKSAKEEFESKNRAYEDLKNYQQSITKQLQKLKSLKDKIEKEGPDKPPTRAYFLLKEIRETLGEMNIMSKDDWQKRVFESWKNRNELEGDLEKKREEWESSKNKLESKTKELEELRANRIDRILENIGNS